MSGLKFGSSTGALNSLITLALLSGDVTTATNLIKQGLQQGDSLDVSQSLAQAASLVSSWEPITCTGFVFQTNVICASHSHPLSQQKSVHVQVTMLADWIAGLL